MKESLNETVERYAEYLEHDARNPVLLRDLGTLYQRMGRLADAETCYLRSLECKPTDPFTRSHLALLWISQHRHLEAIAVLIQLIEEGENDPVLRHNMGMALYGCRRWEDAAAQFALAHDKGLRLSANFAYWSRSRYAVGDLAGALSIARQLLALAGDDDQRGYLAMLELDNGNAVRARSLAVDALASKPTDVLASIVLGTLALESQNSDAAYRHFEIAATHDSHESRAWLGLGLTHLVEQRLPQAIDALRHAMAESPESPGLVVALGWARLIAHDFESAEETFSQALQVDRNFGESHGGMAATMALQGRRDGAREEIRRARGLDPLGFGADFAEAVLLAGEGAPNESDTLIHDILHRSPRDGHPTFANILHAHSRSKSSKIPH